MLEAIISLKEFSEIATRQRGDTLDSFLTVRDMVDLGIVDPATGVVSSGGATGTTGTTGAGVPVGGVAGQIIVKQSNTDYDTAWVDDMVDYATRNDFVGDTVIYRGKAVVGSVEGSAVWQIKRVNFAVDGDSTVEYADSDNLFDNVWTNRASLIYG